MKSWVFFLFLTPTLGLAAEGGAPKAKSKLNTQIYEPDSKEDASFQALVKVVREVQGDTEVFFEGRKGFYVLRSEKFQNLLVKSQQKKKPVSVTVNESTREILNVQPADGE